MSYIEFPEFFFAELCKSKILKYAVLIDYKWKLIRHENSKQSFC